MQILRVRTVLTYGSGGPGLHTAYWQPGTTGGVTADATDCVARVRGFWVGIAAQFPSTFTAQVQSDVAKINDVDGALVGGLAATPVAVVTGSSGAVSGPRAAMILAQLRTGSVLGGRFVRGRWYLGPTKPGVVGATGGVDPATVTAVNAAGTAMLAPGTTASALCVWHRPQPTGAGASYLVDAITTWGEVAVLRSRRDG